MKKIYFLFLSLFLVGLSSCRDDLAKDLQYEDKGDKTETRSLSSNIFTGIMENAFCYFPITKKNTFSIEPQMKTLCSKVSQRESQ